MSTFRLLVCVDTSGAALAAARLAIRLASEHGGVIRAVSVLDGDDTTRRIDALGHDARPAGERLAAAAGALLQRIATLAREQDVPVETALLHGDPLRSILRDAGTWGPDLVLIGRTDRSGPGSPMIGSLAMHVVEFTRWPVVIVPEPEPGP